MQNLNEGRFGPGTTEVVKVSDKRFNVVAGTIENKRRPEAIYITVSAWIKPDLKTIKAKAIGSDDPTEVMAETLKQFLSDFEREKKRFKNFFSPKTFDQAGVIVTDNDLAYSRAKPGMRQFFEFEINVDTVNEIDDDGAPIPSAETGTLERITFKQMLPDVKKAIESILNLAIFNERSPISFADKKGA